MALVAVLLLVGCGSRGGSSPSAPDPEPFTTAASGCELVDGAEITADELGSCTLDGNLVMLSGYTDCTDGTALYVWGDDPGGWIVLPSEDSGTGTWHEGPWGHAWEACYGRTAGG